MIKQKLRWPGFFSTLIPESWEWFEEDGLISIFDPNGVGALQFSFFKITNSSINKKKIASDLAINFAKNKNWHVDDSNIKHVAYGNFPASLLEMNASEDNEVVHWRVWHLIHNTHVLLVTYNCSVDDIGLEDEKVDTILRDVSIEL